MGHKTILDLNHFCYYELINQIEKNCQKTNKPHELKYVDLINFIVCCKPIRELLHENFYKNFFLFYLSSEESLTIDFSELYTRVKGFPAKAKNMYWKSVCLAIEENDNLTSARLRYTPEMHHSEHMEVFESVMNQLRRKKNLKVVRLLISGYTIDDLTGFGNLEQLFLNGSVDGKELCRCCCNNKNLRDLRVLNSEMIRGRLADIAPYCNQVIRFEFKMKFDCDASEYAPLAKMQGLRQLTIHGEHEPGTLQRLFVALARKEPKLSDLSIENALLKYEDTAPLSQIKLLKNLRCGFKDPQSIEPISKMIYLNSLKVLSQHTFISISQQIYSILKESQSEIKIFLKDCKMKYNPKGELRLVLNHVSASDYGLLVTLPHLKCLEINGYYEQGTLVEIFKMLQLVQVECLTIWPMDFHSELQEGVVQCLPLTKPALEVQEIAALSNCGSLKELSCVFADTQNIHLLHNLFALKELNIVTKTSNGSLQALFAALASREVPSLQYFRLLNGAIDSMEAAELARIKSLKLVDCAFVDARDIDKFADLAKEHLETLEITSKQNFHETSPGILRVLQCSENNMWVSTKDIMLMSNRKLRFVVLQMSYSEMYTDETLLVPLESVEWLEELILTYKRDNLKTFFNDISMRTNNRRQVPRLSDTRYSDKGSAREIETCKQPIDFFRGRRAPPSDYFIW